MKDNKINDTPDFGKLIWWMLIAGGAIIWRISSANYEKERNASLPLLMPATVEQKSPAPAQNGSSFWE